MGGDSFSQLTNVANPASFLNTKELEKTKREKNAQDAAAQASKADAAKAAADAEAAKIAKQKEDEEALVRRNLLTAAVKQRLTGRTYSATRLSSGDA